MTTATPIGQALKKSMPHGTIPLEYLLKEGDRGYQSRPSWVISGQRRYWDLDEEYGLKLLWVDTEDQAQTIMRMMNGAGRRPIVRIAFGLIGQEQMQWLQEALAKSLSPIIERIETRFMQRDEEVDYLKAKMERMTAAMKEAGVEIEEEEPAPAVVDPGVDAIPEPAGGATTDAEQADALPGGDAGDEETGPAHAAEQAEEPSGEAVAGPTADTVETEETAEVAG